MIYYSAEPVPKRQILDSFKVRDLVDEIVKFDENGEKFFIKV